jgi:hypothetical protein
VVFSEAEILLITVLNYHLMLATTLVLGWIAKVQEDLLHGK